MINEKAETRFAALADLNEGEKRALRELAGAPCTGERNSVIRYQGGASPIAYFLFSGWAATYQELARGRRQFLKVHVAGDVMGAPSLPFASAADSIIALTDVRYAPIEMERFGRLFVDHPRLAMLFFLTAQEERVILGDRLASIGRRSARERVLEFLIHLADRFGISEGTQITSFDLPLTQQQIGDVLGLTSIHVNRVLGELTAEGVLRIRKPRLELVEIERLREKARLPDRTVARNHEWLPRDLLEGISPA